MRDRKNLPIILMLVLAMLVTGLVCYAEAWKQDHLSELRAR